MAVPEVLVSGNHAEIERWRANERVRRTEARRPDLRRPRGSLSACSPKKETRGL
jgi:tRNA (guanine-N1)-methyltransferase